MGSLSSRIKMFNVYHVSWVKPLKDKKGETVLIAFIEIMNKSNCKPNRLWIDQGRESYNRLMQEQLDNNNLLMYSTHSEGNSVIAERFMKTLKTKIYLKMTANERKFYLSYFHKLGDQYNNTYHHSNTKDTINTDYSAVTKKNWDEF